MKIPEDVKNWLMDGDQAIRWQVMRDLLDAPEVEWHAERAKTVLEGWGAAFISHQADDGVWGGGVYSPKWVSSTYTLLSLREIGIPPGNLACLRGYHVILDRFFGPMESKEFTKNVEFCDLCITGMHAALGVYFKSEDHRLEALLQQLLTSQLPDGGWNCRVKSEKVNHSSFHTTLNVMDGVREVIESAGFSKIDAMKKAEAQALELLAQHRLFRSSRTGEIISDKFLRLPHPSRWHYDILRALDYFQRAGAGRDERLSEAVEILLSKRLPDGTWPVQYPYSGLRFFNMEKTGKPSRWNTLRALRVLKWWEMRQ